MRLRSYKDKVYNIIRKIPYGKVLTYKDVAILAGINSKNGPRCVGYWLSKLPANTDIPWHRVVNSQGKISIKNPIYSKDLQASLLIKEGIKVEGYSLDLARYRAFDLINTKRV